MKVNAQFHNDITDKYTFIFDEIKAFEVMTISVVVVVFRTFCPWIWGGSCGFEQVKSIS